MSDLIDRRAAIDAVSEACEECRGTFARCEEKLNWIPAIYPDHTADIGKKAEKEDCISRQMAIYAAREELESGTYFDIPSKIEALPAVQPEPHWIPCSVRLPDEGQKCLVCDKGSIGIDTYIGHGNPYNWKWYTRDYEAWMPLPKAYQGGDAE